MARNNLESRDFGQLDQTTRQLAWAILGKAPTGTSPYIINMANNLQCCDMVGCMAERLINNQPLLMNWEDLLYVVSEECLRPFHEESYLHLKRVRLLAIEQINMLNKHGHRNLDDYGYHEFRKMKHFELTKEDQNILIWAAAYHDLFKMGYPVKYWDTPGAFSAKQREQLKYHALYFFNLGEFFNVNQWVTALSVLHHYPNHHYPQNGIVKKFEHLLKLPKFQYMLKWLITLDVYEGSSGKRKYRHEIWSHHKVIKERLPQELQGVGLGFVPFLMALMDQNPQPVLCPV